MEWRRAGARGFAMVLLGGICVSAQTSPTLTTRTRRISPKPSATAQRPTTKHDSPRLLTNDDGLAILAAALESRGVAYRREKNSDCSHLVHAIYEHAGFSFPYAPSSDLYLGAEGFERVEHAQPGDLIVWHGHAGIVVSPKQHTFFSALRTGLGVEDYDSAYWMGRGRPRFFRYVKQENEAVVSGPTHTAGLKATELRRRQ